MSNYGFVYVLRNDCMPDVFKIGYTDRAPLKRAEELSASTSVPHEFEIVCYGELEDALQYERVLHEKFDNRRISSNREFFKLDQSELIKLCDEIMCYSTNYCECDGYYEETRREGPIPFDVMHFLSQSHDRTWIYKRNKELFDLAV